MEEAIMGTMSADNSIGTGNDIVSELSNLDFSKIAMSDMIGYVVQFGKNVLLAIIVYFVGRFIIKYAIKALRAVTQKRKVEASLTSFLNSLVSISLNLILAIIIIGILGIDTSSFLAVFASAGIAVGMALSGMLQNFAGGVLILMLKPYKVGDYIEAQGFAGTVREIQIFSTVLDTMDNQTIIIPNGPLATGSLKNSTKAPTRRIDLDVEVAYGTDPDEVRQVLMNVINADERIMQSGVFAPFIPMTTMSTSSIVFQMRIWVKATDYWPVRFDTTEKVYKELGKAGIEIPFQQMDVHIK
ncbi:MAG: mechanosensitive ion channel [Bacteroidaceae bacterium]|nr:mechanosensitive ion channel [Prevotellaceae bacterium]MDD7527080.1 mechanosensitive ion channel [Prevotellaceae bacterium]MDY5759994.1 mechanosensitive ion channel [Bacteroidaceae bacterium]